MTESCVRGRDLAEGLGRNAPKGVKSLTLERSTKFDRPQLKLGPMGLSRSHIAASVITLAAASEAAFDAG